MIVQDDCFGYIPKIESESIDLIITDPPFAISKKSNFTRMTDNTDDILRGKFYKHSIDFGYWDTVVDFDILFSEFYRVLRKGGTLILFYDIWKSTHIREMSEKYKFKQPRIGQWVKSNPVPINSKINYLSNSTEYFFSFIKDKNPTFNSKYDNAIYNYPLCHGKERLDHPTQKPLPLIMDLINKHSNEGDIILDPFSGSGTTAESCESLNRDYICIEKDIRYYEMSLERLKQIKLKQI